MARNRSESRHDKGKGFVMGDGNATPESAVGADISGATRHRWRQRHSQVWPALARNQAQSRSSVRGLTSPEWRWAATIPVSRDSEPYRQAVSGSSAAVTANGADRLASKPATGKSAIARISPSARAPNVWPGCAVDTRDRHAEGRARLSGGGPSNAHDAFVGSEASPAAS